MPVAWRSFRGNFARTHDTSTPRSLGHVICHDEIRDGREEAPPRDRRRGRREKDSRSPVDSSALTPGASGCTSDRLLDVSDREQDVEIGCRTSWDRSSHRTATACLIGARGFRSGSRRVAIAPPGRGPFQRRYTSNAYLGCRPPTGHAARAKCNPQRTSPRAPGERWSTPVRRTAVQTPTDERCGCRCIRIKRGEHGTMDGPSSSRTVASNPLTASTDQ